MDVKTTANEHEEELRDRFAAAAPTALLSHVHRSTAFATRPDKDAEDVAHDKGGNGGIPLGRCDVKGSEPIVTKTSL